MSKPQSNARRPTQTTNKSQIAKQGAKLPDYLVLPIQVDDLRAACALYQSEDQPGVIGMQHIRGILWNFGFWRMTSKEFEKELQSHDIDSRRPSLEWNQLLAIVTKRYYNGGREQEIRDTFKIFDKRERGVTNINEVKNALQSKLEVQVTDAEVNEMFEMAGIDTSSGISLNDFINVMKSF